MHAEARLIGPEGSPPVSLLDKQVRLFSADQKYQLSALLGIKDKLEVTDPLTASGFCIDLSSELIRDQIHYDANYRVLLVNGKPATVIQVMRKMEESQLAIEVPDVTMHPDDVLSRKLHANYAETAAAWTTEATYDLDENSTRFLRDIYEAEKLMGDAGLDFNSSQAQYMKRKFFKKLRNQARSATKNLREEIEPEKIMRILHDINTLTEEEHPAVSHEYAKRILPEIIAIVRRKFTELKNKGDSFYGKFMEEVASLAQFHNRDISELIMELEAIDKQAEENILIEKANRSFWKRLGDRVGRYVEIDLRPDWKGERGWE